MQKSYKHYFILLFLSIIWGSSFILMEKGMRPFKGESTYSDMQVAAIRLFFASVSLLPFLYSSFRKIKQNHILPLFLVGFIGNAIPAFLFTIIEFHELHERLHYLFAQFPDIDELLLVQTAK